jgi:hypothetical protein
VKQRRIQLTPGARQQHQADMRMRGPGKRAQRKIGHAPQHRDRVATSTERHERRIARLDVTSDDRAPQVIHSFRDRPAAESVPGHRNLPSRAGIGGGCRDDL